uniref:Uncharacterized protein n=1 Tax=Arundo donax TaxID=35708 RepID=A0A0A9E5G4_ARUDO
MIIVSKIRHPNFILERFSSFFRSAAHDLSQCVHPKITYLLPVNSVVTKPAKDIIFSTVFASLLSFSLSITAIDTPIAAPVNMPIPKPTNFPGIPPNVAPSMVPSPPPAIIKFSMVPQFFLIFVNTRSACSFAFLFLVV